MSAWLRMGEIEMKKLKIPEYDKDQFKKSLTVIRKLVTSGRFRHTVAGDLPGRRCRRDLYRLYFEGTDQRRGALARRQSVDSIERPL